MNAPTDNAPIDHYRVVVVDDSAVIRGAVSRYLDSQPGIKVVATYTNGRDAVESFNSNVYDVVVLDIQMPVMDGITAIPLILAKQPSAKILISSTLSQRNATISLECLEKGAADYIPKPETAGVANPSARDEFFKELQRKVMALGAASRIARNKPTVSDVSNQSSPSRAPAPSTLAAAALAPVHTKPWPPNFRFDALAIGSSTGGPQALFSVIKHLKGLRQPIFLTQHMPPTFTKILAEHITRQTGVEAVEAAAGDLAKAGRVHLAPGGFHMLAERKGTGVSLAITEDPPENFCRPAVDPMLRSLIPIYGSRLLVVILTGMGQDGLKGAEQVVAAGGGLMAQDAATSVVWGMPGAVSMAGICNAVLSVDSIGPEIQRLAAR